MNVTLKKFYIGCWLGLALWVAGVVLILKMYFFFFQDISEFHPEISIYSIVLVCLILLKVFLFPYRFKDYKKIRRFLLKDDIILKGFYNTYSGYFVIKRADKYIILDKEGISLPYPKKYAPVKFYKEHRDKVVFKMMTNPPQEIVIKKNKGA